MPHREAIELLRVLAGGRNDLLALAGGGMLGSYVAIPGEQNPNYVLAAAYLIVAGADPYRVIEAFENSRRASAADRPRPK